jgi:tetratricopeptide (TPR) repeat protein
MLLSQSQIDDAIKELERAIQIDEKHAAAYYHLGRARSQKRPARCANRLRKSAIP